MLPFYRKSLVNDYIRQNPHDDPLTLKTPYAIFGRQGKLQTQKLAEAIEKRCRKKKRKSECPARMTQGNERKYCYENL